MPLITLALATSIPEVQASLCEFNRDLRKHPDLAWDLVRRARFWIYNEGTNKFAPAKFCGFFDMKFDRYEKARQGNTTGPPFDGHRTRITIEHLIGPFRKDSRLEDELKRQLEAALGPFVVRDMDTGKWHFCRISVSRVSVSLDRRSYGISGASQPPGETPQRSGQEDSPEGRRGRREATGVARR